MALTCPTSFTAIGNLYSPTFLSEVRPFLTAPPGEARPLRILLSASAKDHGLDEHDYPLWLERWSTLLTLADGVTVDTCMGFPTEEQLEQADVTVLYSSNVGWDLRSAKRLADYQERGGGLVYLHWSIEGHKTRANWPTLWVWPSPCPRFDMAR